MEAASDREYGGPSERGTAMADTNERRDRLAQVWRDFAEEQCRGYSPLYERICEAVASNTAVLDLALAAPALGRQPNVLLAAGHYLVLDGVDHRLAEIYQGAADADDAGVAFCDLVLSQREAIAAVLATRHTNTNECGRSAVLVPALRWAAAHMGAGGSAGDGPIAWIDVGASAGVNLNLDRFLLDYGRKGTTGPADAVVRITCSADGDVPVAPAATSIAARIGLDRDPVDLSDDDERRWMLACVWPDTGRLVRTRAALDIAATSGNEILRGDMVGDLATAVERLPPDVPLCVTTSWVVAYLRPERRPDFRAQLRALSASRPVAWIAAEGQGVIDGVTLPAEGERPSHVATDDVQPSILACISYEGGAGGSEEINVLGTCHPHGTWLRWTASPSGG